jgi:gluconokinase
MAAMLSRPLLIVAEEGGTALGAAALGLYALGSAPTLEDARAMLTEADDPVAEVVDPQLLGTYDRLRARVPEQIEELDRIAKLFHASSEAEDPELSGGGDHSP